MRRRYRRQPGPIKSRLKRGLVCDLDDSIGTVEAENPKHDRRESGRGMKKGTAIKSLVRAGLELRHPSRELPVEPEHHDIYPVKSMLVGWLT